MFKFDTNKFNDTLSKLTKYRKHQFSNASGARADGPYDYSTPFTHMQKVIEGYKIKGPNCENPYEAAIELVKAYDEAILRGDIK